MVAFVNFFLFSTNYGPVSVTVNLVGFTYLSNTHSLLASRVLSCVRHGICTNEPKVKAPACNMACVMVRMLHAHAKGFGRGEGVCVHMNVCVQSVLITGNPGLVSSQK